MLILTSDNEFVYTVNANEQELSELKDLLKKGKYEGDYTAFPVHLQQYIEDNLSCEFVIQEDM